MDAPVASRAQALALVERLQGLAAGRLLALRPPPPEPVSCCGRGCNGCVWEGYFDAVGWWREDALQVLALPPASQTEADAALATAASTAPGCRPASSANSA